MGAGKLRTGLLGLDRRGQLVLDALVRSDGFEVIAVADRDAAVAARLAGQSGCAAFDDYRQFTIQNSFDCLIVCAGLHSCLEHVRMAIKKRTHVLKWAPMARGFAEASELAALAAAEQVRFDVATPLLYCDCLSQVRRRLSEGPADRPFLVRAFWDVGRPAETTDGHAVWMTDRGLAGGGVLLHDGYGLIDCLVRSLGMPQQVYCLHRSLASNKAIPYLAEDVAVLSIRFGDGLLAELALIRHWDDRAGCRQVTLYAKDDAVAAQCQRPGICDRCSQALDRTEPACDEMDMTARLLTDYASSLLCPEDHPFASDARTNLRVMAVIEAAYVSAQTGSPETPAKIMDRPT